jgi:hypothetical protein
MTPNSYKTYFRSDLVPELRCVPARLSRVPHYSCCCDTSVYSSKLVAVVALLVLFLKRFKYFTMDDEEMAQIPVMKKPNNMMMSGLNSNNLAATAATRHPVDHLQQQQTGTTKVQFARHVYGSGLAMRLATERKMAAEHVRGAAGLPTSGLYGDIVSGNDAKLDFGDFLSLPEYRPDLAKENPHATMEHQLRM